MLLTITDRERIISHIAHGWKLPDSLVLLLWEAYQEQEQDLKALHDLRRMCDDLRVRMRGLPSVRGIQAREHEAQRADHEWKGIVSYLETLALNVPSPSTAVAERLQNLQADVRRLRDQVEWERSRALLYETQRDLAELAVEDRDGNRVVPALLQAAYSAQRYLSAEMDVDLLRDRLNAADVAEDGRAGAVVREHIDARQALAGALTALAGLTEALEKSVAS